MALNHIPDCPLCLGRDTKYYVEDSLRSYYRCDFCKLVFVPKQFHLFAADEKAIYDQHENHPEDQAYRQFLSRLMTPLLALIPPTAKGLDFGCGPGPTLSLMLEELGFDMTVFDLYYAQHPEVLKQQYDFITSTEVAEHLAQPSVIFDQLFAMLKPDGVLGIMTRMIPDLKNFTARHFIDWHYTRDPTHITFYAQDSFRYLAKKYAYQVEYVGADVVLMTPLMKD